MSINAKPWEGGGGAASVPDASETVKGKIRIATTAESTAGLDDLTAMTPAKVKARIDAAISGGIEYKGTFDASTGLPSLANAEQGDLYKVSTAGTIYGKSWAVGDHLLINADMGGTVTPSKIDKVDNTESVTSVNGQTGATSLGIGDLNNVVISGGGAGGDLVEYDAVDGRWENVTKSTIDLSEFNNNLSADDFAADHTASNYTPANANIDGHLSGIDSALASVGGNQITDVSSQTGSTFTATANVIYVVGYTTGTQTITFPDASASTDGDLIGLTSTGTVDYSLDLVSSDGSTNDLLNMSNQTKGGTNGALSLTVKQELIFFACDGTRWRQLSRELADVAKTGAYSDLSGTPTLATVATTGAYSDLSGTPTLATVATTGAYSDLSGTPTLGTAAALDVGTGANNVVQLDGSSRLPAVDGSQLTNLPSGVTDLNGLSDVTITSAAEGNLLQNNASGQFVNVAKSTIDVGDFNDDSTYQLRDAGLTSIAGLTTSANQMLYTTGSDAYDVTSITAAGRAILDDADATAQRNTLGLGSAATEDVGTGANNVVQLDGSSRLPAVDGSQLTNLPSGASDLDGLSDVTITTPTSSGQILRNNGSGQFVNVALSIVDDTTPQLGGALDVNGQEITSASNGDVTINPNGTGDISVGADIIPDADATHTLGSEDNRFITLHSELNGAVQFKARNETGGALTKGQAVYISGVSGDVPLVSLARANSASTMPAHGLLAADVSNNADVQVISFGNLTAYNTTTHSLSLGDTVYVSAATAGALTSSAPAGETNLIQNIGKVVRASATEGIIKVGGAGRSAATPNLDNGKIFLGNGSNQAVSTALSSAAVTSFNTQTGALTIGGDDLTADHTAVNYTAANANIDGHLSGIDSALALKAPLASPSLTGTPTAPTAAQGDNSTQLATTAYVDTAVAGGGGGTSYTYSAITAGTTTAQAWYHYSVDTSSGAVTLNLPALSGLTDGDEIRVKLRDATNSVTIDANASENIDGSLTYTLDVAYQAVTLVVGSTEWEII